MLRPGETYTLAQTLPHGPSMLLLDRLASYDAESLTCEVTIRADSRFCDGAAVPSWVGVEYMAQALGSFTGVARLQQGKKVQLEMLLGTRACDCAVPAFAVGQRLTVRAQLLYWDPDGVCAFDCDIRDGERELARAEIKGYEPDDVEPFLRQLEAQHAARGHA